jgi:hypothetical protein
MANLTVWIAASLMTVGAWAAGPPQAIATARPRPASGGAAQRTAAQPRIAQPRVTDAQLEAVIRAKFAKSKINADKFTVRVQGGIATIDGQTDVVQHKGTATRMCKTAGAVAVNNRVKISEAARQKAAGNLEAGRRRVQVKRGDPRSELR